MDIPMIYEIRKPSEIDPSKSYPAIFVFHGIGSNEQNMLSLIDGLEDTFYVFSIRGHLAQPPGYAYFTIQGYGKPNRDIFDHAISKLTSFIDYAVDEYPIDHTQLYLLGFSQGAIVSMTLGLSLGNRIKGIVALSGYIPQFVKEEYDIKSIQQLSLFISHGRLDNILPYEWGVESQDLFQKLGADVTFEEYPEGHTVSIKNQQDFKKWLFTNLKRNNNY